jgi:uncharacterized protein
MRLRPFEHQAITHIVQETDRDAALYLFGSRTDDQRKGGDIDLFLEPSIPLDLRAQLKLQQRLMSACDSKVDLLVKNPTQTETPFFSLARQGIRL